MPVIYEKYMKDTPMFIPGEPGGKIYGALFGWIRPSWLGLFTVYCTSMLLAISLAMILRNYTVKQLGTVLTQDTTILSVFPRPAEEIRELYQAVSSSEEFV